MPSPPSESHEPPDQQRRDADADCVQREDFSVPGERQRYDQQRRNDDHDRQPSAPHYESEDHSDDRSDPFPNVHLFTSFITCPARHPKRREPCVVLPRRVRSPARRMPSNEGCLENAPTATGVSPDGVRGKRTQFGLSQGKRQGSATGEVRIAYVPNAGRKCLGECDESCQSLPRTRYGRRSVRSGELRQEASDRDRDDDVADRRVSKGNAESVHHHVGNLRADQPKPCGRRAEPVEAIDALRLRLMSSDEAPYALRPSSPDVRSDVRGSKARPFSTASRCGKRLVSRGPPSGSEAQPFGPSDLGDRSGSKAQPYAKIPGSETEPPGFSGVETLESQTVKPLSGTVLPVGKGFGDFPLKPVATLCQDFAALEQHFAKGDYRHRPRVETVRTRRSRSSLTRFLGALRSAFFLHLVREHAFPLEGVSSGGKWRTALLGDCHFHLQPSSSVPAQLAPVPPARSTVLNSRRSLIIEVTWPKTSSCPCSGTSEDARGRDGRLTLR